MELDLTTLDLTTMETITPDVLDVLQQRFLLLQNIYRMQPVGRRLLADKLDLTERVLRSQTDILRKLQLIEVSRSGMNLSKKGGVALSNLESMVDSINGIRILEKRLLEYFKIKNICVVAGDCKKQPKIFEEFGKIVTGILDSFLPTGENIISVMGGTTIAKVAQHLSNLQTKGRHNTFIPARGGVGEAFFSQANTISSQMAENSAGKHRALYVPEQISKEACDFLSKEPVIQDVLGLIGKSNCVIHSIGCALYTATKRKMSEEEIIRLRLSGAVAEAFGYFFDEDGFVVYKLPCLGLQLRQLANVRIVLMVACGKSKAQAIVAYLKNAPVQTRLVIDEAAAREMLKLVEKSQISIA